MKIIKKHKYASAMGLMLIICITCFLMISYKVNAAEDTATSKLNSLMSEINSEVKNHDPRMLSSNPYDYIDGRQDYMSITDEGFSAIPELIKAIEVSSENGLKEYIAAIAVEEITNTNLRKENVYTWSNGKEWLEQWNIHLRNIPSKVEYIVTDTQNTIAQKEEALKSIGVMALPCIEDAITQGHTEFQDVYKDMLSENKLDTKLRESNTDISILRDLVETVRVD